MLYQQTILGIWDLQPWEQENGSDHKPKTVKCQPQKPSLTPNAQYLTLRVKNKNSVALRYILVQNNHGGTDIYIIL